MPILFLCFLCTTQTNASIIYWLMLHCTIRFKSILMTLLWKNTDDFTADCWCLYGTVCTLMHLLKHVECTLVLVLYCLPIFFSANCYAKCSEHSDIYNWCFYSIIMPKLFYKWTRILTMYYTLILIFMLHKTQHTLWCF